MSQPLMMDTLKHTLRITAVSDMATPVYAVSANSGKGSVIVVSSILTLYAVICWFTNWSVVIYLFNIMIQLQLRYSNT